MATATMGIVPVACLVAGIARRAVHWAMIFSYRVDRWTDDGNSSDYVAAVGDLAMARAAYRAAWAGSEDQEA
jgi:hypothetical protein